MSIQNIEPASNLKYQTEKIFVFALNEYKMGRTEETVKARVSALRRVAAKAELNSPDQVLMALAELKWKNRTKNTFLDTYGAYCKFLGILWNRPKYENEERLPFIPTEQEIDTLISASQYKLATTLQMLKETGMRISELLKLKWTNLDFVRKTVNITPSKGSNPRLLPISNLLFSMFDRFDKTTEYIFPRRKNGLRLRFDRMRKRIASRTQNPRLMQISFHTFRHWKGTMEYHKTKDIMHVRFVLGHKAIQSTMVYINIEQAIFNRLSEEDEWICKTAKTLEEVCKLIETGFQYVIEMDGVKIFKKRK